MSGTRESPVELLGAIGLAVAILMLCALIWPLHGVLRMMGGHRG